MSDLPSQDEKTSYPEIPLFANCDRLETVRVLPETSPEMFQATLIFQGSIVRAWVEMFTTMTSNLPVA